MNLITNIHDQPVREVTTINGDVLEEEITRLETDFNMVTPQIESAAEVLRDLPKDVSTAFAVASGNFIEGRLTDQEYFDEVNSLQIPPELINIILQKAEIRRKIEILQVQAFPYKVEKLQNIVEKARNSLNLMRVVEYYADGLNRKGENIDNSDMFPNFWDYEYTYLLELSNKLINNQIDYDEYISIETQLKRVVLRWEKKGFLENIEDNHNHDVLDEQDANLDASNLESLIKAGIKKIDRFSNLKWGFRPGNIGFSGGERFLREVISILESSKLKVDQSPELLKILIQKCGSVIDRELELPISNNRVYESQYLDTETLLQQIEISGISAGAGKVLVVREADILDVLRNIPPVFLKKVRGVTRCDKPKNDVITTIDKDSDIKIGDPVGEFFPECDSDSRLVDGEISIYWPCDIDKNASEKDKDIMKEHFMLTLYHEFGHRIHFELSLVEMEEWIQITRDGYNLTDYVESSRNDNVNIGVREDFSESFMVFMVYPDLLYSTNRTRYEYFLNLVSKYKTQA